MINPVSLILRSATRKGNTGKLNIGTFVCHERFDENLAKTGHNFYIFSGPDVRSWNAQYSPVPKNFYFVKDNRLPPDVDLDLFVIGNAGVHYPIVKQLVGAAPIPVVNVWHVTPPPGTPVEQLKAYKENFKDTTNVFITEYNRAVWNYKPHEGTVIHHGIDTGAFAPDPTLKRKSHILTVANDYINRDWCLGFRLYQYVTQGMPTRPVGHTPRFSQAAPTQQHLIREYQEAGIFLNTSQHSPTPMSLLEAMSCGCAVVSTSNCAIPSLLRNNDNALISNDANELRGYLELLLRDESMRKQLGAKARKTILDRFPLRNFVDKYNAFFEKVLA